MTLVLANAAAIESHSSAVMRRYNKTPCLFCKSRNTMANVMTFPRAVIVLSCGDCGSAQNISRVRAV